LYAFLTDTSGRSVREHGRDSAATVVVVGGLVDEGRADTTEPTQITTQTLMLTSTPTIPRWSIQLSMPGTQPFVTTQLATPHRLPAMHSRGHHGHGARTTRRGAITPDALRKLSLELREQVGHSIDVTARRRRRVRHLRVLVALIFQVRSDEELGKLRRHYRERRNANDHGEATNDAARGCDRNQVAIAHRCDRGERPPQRVEERAHAAVRSYILDHGEEHC
jgi:hypothetical protein